MKVIKPPVANPQLYHIQCQNNDCLAVIEFREHKLGDYVV